MAVTVQGVPEGVLPPVVKALSPSSLSLSWSEPSRQNGIIQLYHLNQTGIGTVFTHTDGPKNYTVKGRKCASLPPQVICPPLLPLSSFHIFSFKVSFQHHCFFFFQVLNI